MNLTDGGSDTFNEKDNYKIVSEYTHSLTHLNIKIFTEKFLFKSILLKLTWIYIVFLKCHKRKKIFDRKIVGGLAPKGLKIKFRPFFGWSKKRKIYNG